jgi:glycosyltransferase involved in cell wall biosynthesis
MTFIRPINQSLLKQLVMNQYSCSLLFVGTFLSTKKGSKGPSEIIFEQLEAKGWKVGRTSESQYRFVRLFEVPYTLIFRSSKYKIVHIDVFSGKAFWLAFAALILSKLFRKKVVLTFHGGKLLDFYIKKKLTFRILFKLTDIILTPSKFLQKGFLNYGHSIEYMPNPLDLVLFKSSDLLKQTNDMNFKILWVRAFSDIYNPIDAIMILYEVRNKGLTATLTMVGPDMGCLNEVNTKIIELELEAYITITGPIQNKLLPSLYNNHDCFINTTSYESFGVSMFEAASCRIPICSYTVGEIGFLWEDGVDYLGSKLNDVSHMAENILKISRSEKTYKSITTSAEKKVGEFEMNLVLKKWVNKIKSLE